MTNYPYRALVGCVGLLIGTLSGCAAAPAMPAAAPFQTLAAPDVQPCSSEAWAKDHPLSAPEAAAPAPSEAEMKLKQLYARGFKEGFTDAVRARRFADKRKKPPASKPEQVVTKP